MVGINIIFMTKTTWMWTIVTGSLECLSQIQKALDKDYFELHFQTIKSLAGDRDKLRYEILLRMFDDDESLVSPAMFIPIAERYGLMPRIDEWVFEKTVALLEDISWLTCMFSKSVRLIYQVLA